MGIIFDASPIENVGGTIGLRTFTHTFTGGAAALLFSGELQASVHRPINVKVGGVDLPLVAQDVQGTPARYGGLFAVASGVPAGLQTVEVLVRTTQDDQFCVAVDVHESDGHALVIGASGAGNGASGVLSLTLDSGAEDARALCVMAITATQGALRPDFTGLSGGMARIGIDHWFAEETATTVGPRTVGFLGNSIWAGAGMLWLDLGPPPSDFAVASMGALAGMSPGLSFVGGGLDVMLGACGAVAGMGRTLRLELPIDEQVALVNQHGMPGRTHGGTTAQALLRRVGDSPYWGDVVTSGGGGDISLHVDAAVTGAHDVDHADGATHKLTLIADATLTPVGTAAADETVDIRVRLFPEGFTVAWGGTILWDTADGLAPDLTGLTAGESIVVGFLSDDGGTTWLGFTNAPAPPASPGIAVAEADGAPDVADVTRIEFDGASVTDDGGGQVTVTISASPGGGGGYDEGTSFPVSPAAGDPFRRTDIRGGLLFWFDGTRWLSDQVFQAHGLRVEGITADFYTYMAVPADYPIYVTHAHFLLYVSGAATWVAALQTNDFDNGLVTLVSKSTAGQTAGKFYHFTEAVGAVVDTDNGNATGEKVGLAVLFDEQSGAVSFYGAVTADYRLIAT
jgi:hypothetical protein